MQEEYIQKELWGCMRMFVGLSFVNLCTAAEESKMDGWQQREIRQMSKTNRRTFLGGKLQHYLKLIAQQQKNSRGICLGSTGGETVIDNLKSLTAHYSSDNLETAVGGIDRQEWQSREKQEVWREKVHEMLKLKNWKFVIVFLSFPCFFNISVRVMNFPSSSESCALN